VKAIIPAAGIGTRLRPHTYTLPKALLFVAGKPIICHILDEVLALGPSSIILIIGYKGDLIQNYVEKHYPDAPVEFVVQEQRKGIGHAVSLTESVANTGEPLLIILGDTIIKADLRSLIAMETNVLGVKSVEDPRRFGVCILEENRIVGVVEKPENPPSNQAIVGLYYIPNSGLLFDSLHKLIENDIKRLGEYQITDALQQMIESGAEFRPFTIEEWFDCGKRDALVETNRCLLEGSPAPTLEGSVLIPPVSVSPQAKVVNSIIGPNVSVAPEVEIENSIIRDSVLDAGASVMDSLLDGSIVGSKAVVVGEFQSLNIGDSCEITPSDRARLK
jgi:glucose-1-phosphate thymidylyltransferase